MSGDYTISRERRAELVEAFGEATVRHSERFRKVSNRYPNVVALAYGRDLDAAAAAASDEEVAATVTTWEEGQGLEPRDWHAIGAKEREDDEP
jgi:hypothetical protein